MPPCTSFNNHRSIPNLVLKSALDILFLRGLLEDIQKKELMTLEP